MSPISPPWRWFCGKLSRRSTPPSWRGLHAVIRAPTRDAYKFLHDRIQQAAYSLIQKRAAPKPTWRWAAYCWRACRGPARRASVRCREPAQSGRRATDRAGREGAGGDDRSACGRKAKASAAMRQHARISPSHGAVGGKDWSSQHQLAFSLWLQCAECEAAER